MTPAFPPGSSASRALRSCDESTLIASLYPGQFQSPPVLESNNSLLVFTDASHLEVTRSHFTGFPGSLSACWVMGKSYAGRLIAPRSGPVPA